MQHEPSLSVVVPFYNEALNIDSFCRELREAVGNLNAEIVLVDDGSTDDSRNLLDNVGASWPSCRILHFPENRGQSAALLAGFTLARAPIIVTMDGDGQNDPRDIPAMLRELGSVDMIVGVRSSRKDSWARRAVSRIANSIRSRLLGDNMTDSGCALKVFRREVVPSFIPIRTLYSFMPALAIAAGFSVTEVPVHHRARHAGTSCYTLRHFLVMPIIDFIGVWWFCRRRCRPPAFRASPGHAPEAREVAEVGSSRGSVW